jgi:hypothetical protein
MTDYEHFGCVACNKSPDQECQALYVLSCALTYEPELVRQALCKKHRGIFEAAHAHALKEEAKVVS